jgi:hypothetical protein
VQMPWKVISERRNKKPPQTQLAETIVHDIHNKTVASLSGWPGVKSSTTATIIITILTYHMRFQSAEAAATISTECWQLFRLHGTLHGHPTSTARKSSTR